MTLTILVGPTRITLPVEEWLKARVRIAKTLECAKVNCKGCGHLTLPLTNCNECGSELR